ncbi:hypothetical protein IGI39_000569 [Enterococcus sp. AZ135]|uniref:DUF4176 domain-containing protein n=1 Tax=unclassified Enterococcus TaxID=2608891 RepID=UPI003F1FFA6B
MEINSIGTVVTLKKDDQKLMITSRFPLYNNNGEIGYFDYAGCLYPQGQVNEENYFFNNEDISVINFEGYVSDEEVELREEFDRQFSSIKYPRFVVGDIE